MPEALRVGGEPIGVTEDTGVETLYLEYRQIVSRAVEVFGSELEATRWLSNATHDFGGRTPLQSFVEEGPASVLMALGRIEHGVFF